MIPKFKYPEILKFKNGKIKKRMWIEIPILLLHRFHKVLFLRKYTLLDFGFLTKEASWIHQIFKIWCHGKKI